MKIRKNDLVLAVVVIVIAAAALAGIYLTKQKGGQVTITIGSEVYKTVPLQKNDRIEINRDGETNIVVIEDGAVYMESANCPDKICVNHSKIKYKGETIVCLPHRLVVEITEGEEQKADIVAQ